jgi:hypothetical protein
MYHTMQLYHICPAGRTEISTILFTVHVFNINLSQDFAVAAFKKT